MDQDEYGAAAACMVAAGGLARDYQDELLGRVGRVFARREPRLQAGKYVRALTAEVPRKNGWQIAEWAGDATPDKTQRLLNHAGWDEHAAMGVVAAFVAEHLGTGEDPLAVVVLDESGQEKKGESTCGVKRQYVGCAGRLHPQRRPPRLMAGTVRHYPRQERQALLHLRPHATTHTRVIATLQRTVGPPPNFDYIVAQPL